MSDSVELPIMHWIWITALSGIISNIGWELFNYFGHAAIHSFSSAWHEFKKLPKHILSLHAPVRIVGVVLASLAFFSLVQSTSSFDLGVMPLQLIEAYRSFAHQLGDMVFAAIINPDTRSIAYDAIIAALILVSIVWRTASGWRHYDEFQNSHADGTAMSFGTYFGLQILSGIGAIAIALAVLERL